MKSAEYVRSHTILSITGLIAMQPRRLQPVVGQSVGLLPSRQPQRVFTVGQTLRGVGEE